MKFSNMKISARLAALIASMMLVMVIMIVIGLFNMSRIQASLNEIVGDNNLKTKLVSEMSEAVHIVARVMRTMVLLKDNDQKEVEYQKIEAARARYDTAVEALEKLPATETGLAIRAKIREAAATARPLNTQVIDLGRAGKTSEAVAVLMKKAGPATTVWQEALDENLALQEQNTQNDHAVATTAYEHARNLMIGLSTGALLLGTLLAWLVTRSIVRPLQQMVAVANEIAAGGLDQTVDHYSKDETWVLADAFRQMIDKLKQVVGQVRESSFSITSAASEIAKGNTDLSQRTQEQASALEETSATMEEMTSTIKQNADNARQANQLGVAARDQAERGGEVVRGAVTAMGEINTASKKIVDIIGVIDEIAFQTNLLALNAAVEAARAGEQGRGFAVVAAEVRNLAQRSAGAAKEIKSLIKDSVGKVDEGSKLVNESGATLSEIVASVKKVSDIIAEIAAASQEQSTGVEQVSKAITQMDEVTQQNAALVEQAAAASESTSEQARTLTEVIGFFKTSGEGGVVSQTKVPALPAPVAQPVAEGERRSAKRPWGGAKQKPSAPAAAPAHTSGKKVAAGGGDAEWETF